MKSFYGSFEIGGKFVQQFYSRHNQAGAVAAICHGDQLDFVVPAELGVFLRHSLEAFCAGNA
jgi:hypothetical protein